MELNQPASVTIERLKSGKWKGELKNPQRTITIKAESESSIRKFLEDWTKYEKKAARKAKRK